jgi:hypothetical protein
MIKRLSLIALAAVLSLALPVLARQSPANAAVAPVDQHLKMLADKLDLTADQQDKARPILQEMHDDSEKIMDDKSLSHDEAMARMHPVFMKADKALREFLTDDQKKKLDEMEQQMHPQQHESTPPQQ